MRVTLKFLKKHNNSFHNSVINFTDIKISILFLSNPKHS